MSDCIVRMVNCPHCGEAVEVWINEDGDPEDIRPGCECAFSMDDDRSMVDEALRALGVSVEDGDG